MATIQIVLLLIALLLSLLAFQRKKRYHNLPPGPPAPSLIRNLLAATSSGGGYMQSMVHICMEKYGPIFTIWNGNSPLVVIADRQLAHEALVKKKSVVFAGRPPAASGFRKLFTCNGRTINSASHGDLWRALRSTMVTNIHTQKAISEYHEARENAISGCLYAIAKNPEDVQVRQQLRCLLNSIMFSICFGVIETYESPSLKLVNEAMWNYQASLLSFDDSLISMMIPWKRSLASKVSKIVKNSLLPHIRSAVTMNQGSAYIHMLLNLTVDLDGEQRKLSEAELVALCTEFIIGGVDSTVTTLEWALAHLINDHGLQEKLHQEIVRDSGGHIITEENAKDNQYLLAMVKETLRMHPPAPMLPPHAVQEDAKIGRYDIPRGTRVSFYGHAMAMDPSVWKEPNEFRPERFMDGGEGEHVDLTATKDMSMLPFGAGRRVCAGIGLGMMHLTYVLARLVQRFKWQHMPGKNVVDFSNAPGFTMMMKHPLRAIVSERTINM